MQKKPSSDRFRVEGRFTWIGKYDRNTCPLCMSSYFQDLNGKTLKVEVQIIDYESEYEYPDEECIP